MKVLLFLLIGMAAGYLCRQKRAIKLLSDKLLSISIFLLLFLLGLSVGSNQQIIANLNVIGFNAIVLAAAGVLGSIFFAYLIYKFFLHNRK